MSTGQRTVAERAKALGKYAPVPGCSTCKAIGCMCLTCGVDWRMKHVDEELAILRRVLRMAASIATPHYPGLAREIEKWRKHRRAKPPRRKEPTDG